MATVLDVGLFSFLLPFFVFVFTFVVLYALLSKTELLGKNQVVLNFVAAFCIAAVAVFTGSLIGVVRIVVPWLVFIIIILVLLFGMFKFFGTADKDIWSTIGGQTVIYVLILIVILVALSQVFESDISPYKAANGTIIQQTQVKSEVIKTLTHPRLLGALFILITSAFTVKLLIDKVE